MTCWRSTKTRNTRRMRRCAILRCENLARALAHAPAFHLPQYGVICQLDLNRESYLLTYSWLRIEEHDKWHCWICRQYGGAKDKLGTDKARPSRPEKLTEHAVNKSHIEAMRVHEAKLKREKQLLEGGGELDLSAR